MVNPRMLALAAALLLLPVGLGAASDPLFGAYNEVVAEVRNLRVLEPPGEREVDPASLHTADTLVEGHTVFAVIDVRATVHPPAEKENNVTVVGDVHCDGGLRYQRWDLFGLIPIPTEVTWGGARCDVGTTVLVVPHPFEDGAPARAWSEPTGDILPFTTPAGESSYARELAWHVLVEEENGATRHETYTAWSVPVLHPWQDGEGRTYNFLVPIPRDALEENGVSRYRSLPGEWIFTVRG